MAPEATSQLEVQEGTQLKRWIYVRAGGTSVAQQKHHIIALREASTVARVITSSPTLPKKLATDHNTRVDL